MRRAQLVSCWLLVMAVAVAGCGGRRDARETRVLEEHARVVALLVGPSPGLRDLLDQGGSVFSYVTASLVPDPQPGSMSALEHRPVVDSVFARGPEARPYAVIITESPDGVLVEAYGKRLDKPLRSRRIVVR